MGSSLLDNLGQMHIVAGVTAADGESLTTCNDNSASIATTSTGLFTVTFGQPFLSAPVVTASVVEAALSTIEAHGVIVVSVATNEAVFQSYQINVNGGTATDIANAADDLVVHFIAVGLRDN